MGRWPYSNRSVVEDCRSIDINWLHRESRFQDSYSGSIFWKNHFGEKTSSLGYKLHIDFGEQPEGWIKLEYSFTNRGESGKDPVEIRIDIVTTPCNFGGYRYWFVCPLFASGEYCGRRVGKIYLPPGGRYYGCRHCYDLTYTSSQEHDKTRDRYRRLDYETLVAMMRRGEGELPDLRAATELLDRARVGLGKWGW